MLRVLGKILGIKHGSIVVDAFISDFYEASMEQVPSFGAAHIEWLHEWIGSLVIAKEVSLSQSLRQMCCMNRISATVVLSLRFLPGLFLWTKRPILGRSKKGDESVYCNRWHHHYSRFLSILLFGIYRQ
jgi:hypothetical protein